MQGLAFRPATEDDLDRLVEIHSACFPDERNHAARRRNFEQNALGRLGDLRLATLEGTVVGHGFAFPLRAYFGGISVSIVGIASIGVAPEARGRGVASALLEHLHTVADQCGAACTMLFAYRHGFYARHGYGDVACNHRFGSDPRAVPHAWVDMAKRASLRAPTGADREALVACHRRQAVQRTGWLDRPEALWSRLLLGERMRTVFLAREGEGRAAGYVIFEIQQQEPHADTRLFVHDLVADDDAAGRVLWGFLGMQAGQIAEIQVEVDARDPIAFALTDADGRRPGTARVEHDLGSIVAGPMLRLVDVGRALAARGYACDGAIDLDVDGNALRLEVEAGSARIGPSRGSGVALDRRTLASIAFGGLGAGDAARLGLLRGTPAAIACADALLHLPPFHTIDRF